MTLDSSLLKQLIETFHVELESLLSIIIDNLQQIKSSDPANDRSVMMEEISRAGRNIKVSALSVGVDHLGTIAEYIEKLFLPTTNTLSEDLINLTFQAVNGMREVMHDFIEKTPHSATVHELIHQLQQQVYETEKEEEPGALIVEKKQDVDEVVPSLHGLDDDFLKKIMETFAIELQENLIIITNGLLQLENGGRSEQEFLHLFAEIFRAAHNIKGSARGVGAMAVGDIAHHIETLFTVIQQKNIKISPVIINLCLQSIDYMSEAMRCYSDHIPISFDLPHHLMQLEHYTQFPLEEMQPTIGKSFSFNETFKIPEIAIKANEFESIRVSLQNLDRVSAYMEEIQAIKIAIEEHYSDLNKINCKIDYFVQATKKRLFKLKDLLGDENEGFDSLSAIHLSELTEISNVAHKIQRELRMPVNELSILLNSLQDEVGTMRLIPISSQLRYLPRVVRDLAIELGKQVIFEIKSNEVTIDKMIMDGLKDPIVHILRNAIDHGIESSAVREAKGKPPQGSIVINVSQEDHQIVFEISDDGAGIRADDVSRIALSKNIITQAELAGMKPEDVIDLIFRPGFSTREIATDISGRGVGLDVVRSNLMHLKGHVSVENHLGKGSHFFLRVPITLATERGLIISSSGQIFVILISSVESVFLLKKQDIMSVEGSPAILVKQQPVLLCSLSQILHLDENTQNIKEHISVIIIQKNCDRIALLVDEIIGEREIVLKPLQEPLTNIPYVIGATMTGGNQINFVLNSSEIIKKALL